MCRLAFRSCLRDGAGVAAVEFGLIAPILVTLVGAAWDLGTGVNQYIRLENAARAGAQYATSRPSDTAGIQAAVLAALPGWTNATATAGTIVCQCPAAGAASVSAGGATVACTSTCATGMERTVSVTASRPFTPIFPTSALISFNNLGTTTRTVVARVS